MSILQKVIPTDTFLSWLNKYNIFADAANPAGTGIVEFNNILVNGSITFGSSAITTIKTVDIYDLDEYYTPRVVSIESRPTCEFAKGKTCSIRFSFDLSEFSVISTDRKIGFGYTTLGAGTGNAYFRYSYWVNRNGYSMSPVADGTGFTIVDITGTSSAYRYVYVATLPVSSLSDSNYSLTVKMDRIGANILDTSTSSIYVYDVKVE